MKTEAILQLITRQDYAAADAALLARLSADRQDLEALFVRANLLYAAENYEQAAAHNAAALRLIDLNNPAAAPLLLQAGDIALVCGQHAQALDYFAAGQRLAPQDASLGRQLYRELRIAGAAQAAPLLDRLIALAGGQAAALYDLAGDLAAFEDPQALDLLDEAVRQTDNPDLLHAIRGERLGLQLHAGNCPAQAIEACLAIMPVAQRDKAAALIAPAPFPAPANNSVTVVVTTNLTKKLIVNRAKAPPCDTLLRETLASFRSVLQPDADCRLVIYYDAPKDLADPDHAPYLAALERLAGEYTAELRVRHANGLRRNYIEAVTQSDTPYFMLLEHDWLFDPALPTLPTLAATPSAHPFIHLLRFNKRYSVAMRHDHTLRRDSRVHGLPILRTSNFSNNPHIARTAKLQRDILPLIAPDASLDAVNAGAGGVEETVCAYLNRLQQRYGFTLSQRWSGCCLYGRENDPPRLTHTGI